MVVVVSNLARPHPAFVAAFDRGAFLADLDAVRIRRGQSWISVAEQIGTSSRALYYLSRDERDIGAELFARLIAWAGLVVPTAPT